VAEVPQVSFPCQTLNLPQIPKLQIYMPVYPGISSEAFRHPLDQQAERALRSVPGFDLVARRFVEFVYERPRQVFLLGNAIEVGPRQYSTLFQPTNITLLDCYKDRGRATAIFHPVSTVSGVWAIARHFPRANAVCLSVADRKRLRPRASPALHRAEYRPARPER